MPQTYQELRHRLSTLEQEQAEIRKQGDVLFDARIDSSKPGGRTARGCPSTQYRLRVKGQKATYLQAKEVPDIKAAIARAKQLRKLEREIVQVQRQLDRIVAIAQTLGLKS